MGTWKIMRRAEQKMEEARLVMCLRELEELFKDSPRVVPVLMVSWT